MTNRYQREGLEKMEREKQRQAERDREMKERDEKRRQEKIIEQNLFMQLNANDSSPKLPAKSKFVCHSLSYFLSLFVVASQKKYNNFVYLLQKLDKILVNFQKKKSFPPHNFSPFHKINFSNNQHYVFSTTKIICINFETITLNTQETDSESDNDDTVNSDYNENMPKSKAMAERTTVGNASASASTTVPTFKPHRTKAEILTEIVSDNLIRFACDL